MPNNPASEAPDKKSKSNLTRLAYAALKSNIVMNKIKAGECLSGTLLAKKLNMSRTPVREALNILAREGFVEIHNGVGIYVKKVSEKDMLELVEVRSALECSALGARTLNVDQEKLGTLYDAWLGFRNQIESGQKPGLDEVTTLDYQTHDFIVRSSHNSYLVKLIENVSARFKQTQYLSVLGLDDAASTVNQHLEILGAIKSGDIPQATSLLRSHIMEAVVYILNPASRRGKKSGKPVVPKPLSKEV